MQQLQPPDFKRLFESLPGFYLILEPDFTIVAVSDNYLKATLTERETILGKGLFEVFPDNPDDIAANGVSNLRSSLMKVLERKKPNPMPFQKYDIRRPDGSFEVRHWKPVNTPVLDEDKNVVLIIHEVEDVSDVVTGQQEDLRQKQLMQESHAMNVQLRELSLHLQNLQEDERAAISRMIQGELGQQIRDLKMEISLAVSKLNGQNEEVTRKLEATLPVFDKAADTIRKITSDLRPGLLDNMGLLAAIEWYLREFEKKTGIFTTFIATIPEPAMPDIVRTSLFRIVQDSLSNVNSHSMAGSVVINIEQENNELTLTVHDNGIGFNAVDITKTRALGILGMKERAAMMGATYDIDSTPGRGTAVVVKINMDWK